MRKHYTIGLIYLIISTFCVEEVLAQEFNIGKIEKKLKSFWSKPYQKQLTTGKLEVTINNKTIVIYGTSHMVNDPRDTLFQNMQKVIDHLKPTVLFTEVDPF